MTSAKHTAYQEVIAILIDHTNTARTEAMTAEDVVAWERWKLFDAILGKLQTQRAKLKPPPPTS